MEEYCIKNSFSVLKDKNYNIFKCVYCQNNNKVRILGEKFVNKNKYKCKIIYKNKIFELKEWLEDIDKNYKYKKLIKLKLKFVNNIIDISYLFEGCNKLLSVLEVVKGNRKKILIEANNASLSEYRNQIAKLQMYNNKFENNIIYRDKNELLLSISYLLIIKINNIKNIDKIFVSKTSNINIGNNIFRILLDYNKLNISNVINIINMKNLFNGCNILKEVKIINSFNTSKVNDINSMFQGCNELEYLDLSDLNVSNISNMQFFLKNVIN